MGRVHHRGPGSRAPARLGAAGWLSAPQRDGLHRFCSEMWINDGKNDHKVLQAAALCVLIVLHVVIVHSKFKFI